MYAVPLLGGQGVRRVVHRGEGGQLLLFKRPEPSQYRELMIGLLH